VAIDATPDLRGVRFAEEVEGAAYFLVSEGLANILKHASVTAAAVRLSLVGDRLVVEVADHGVGFVPADVSGSGLTGLRDRVVPRRAAVRLLVRLRKPTSHWRARRSSPAG